MGLALRRFLGSSLGGKLVLAVAGLLLFGFLVSHVAGNVLLLRSDGGAAYDAYAARLRGLGPLLWVARAGLAALFGVHIGLAFRVAAVNRRARGPRYHVRPARERRTSSSSSMLLTGTIVLAFLAAHLWQFSFDRRFEEHGAGYVADTLGGAGTAALYAVGITCLWIHLWHALPAALQTLGIAHPRWSPPLRAATRVALSVLCALFLGILFAAPARVG